MTSELRVLVVDDEPIARRRLRKMIERMDGAHCVGEASDGVEALARIEELELDVLLLDIQMPGLDGIRLAKDHAIEAAVIFTTAYDRYAVEAFEAAAVDYLLKPIEAPRLVRALQRVRERAGTAPALDKVREILGEIVDRRASPRVSARSGETVRIFDARKLTRFHSSDKYTAFTFEDEEFLSEESLNALEARLGACGFVRVHRSELVNVEEVVALHHESGFWELELTDGQRAQVSRRMSAEIKRRLGVGG